MSEPDEEETPGSALSLRQSIYLLVGLCLVALIAAAAGWWIAPLLRMP